MGHMGYIGDKFDSDKPLTRFQKYRLSKDKFRIKSFIKKKEQIEINLIDLIAIDESKGVIFFLFYFIILISIFKFINWETYNN